MKYKGMEAQDVIILIVHANENELLGRSLLQKLAYFWTLSISDIRGACFEPHYYGPYSSKVRQALGMTVANSLVDEKTMEGPPYARYLYRITENGKNTADRLADNHKEEFRQIAHIIKTCKDNDDFQYDKLIHAAKTRYTCDKMSKDADKSMDDMIEKARSLGWVMEQTEIQDGMKLLKKLRLV